ncbi:MAG: hypothetical protein SVY15_09655 [Halobacteriota archaeon]|nr:hypothetical protein [Halobacteriota archaeon]
MKRTMSIVMVTIMLLSLVAGFLPFWIGGNANETITKVGTVVFVDLEGGFFGIVCDNGERYDPINLGWDYREDGVKVEFQAVIRDDLQTTRMWGTTIEIIDIEVL